MPVNARGADDDLSAGHQPGMRDQLAAAGVEGCTEMKCRAAAAPRQHRLAAKACGSRPRSTERYVPQW